MTYQGYDPNSPSSARLSPNSRYSGTSKPRFREPSQMSQPACSGHRSGVCVEERRVHSACCGEDGQNGPIVEGQRVSRVSSRREEYHGSPSSPRVCITRDYQEEQYLASPQRSSRSRAVSVDNRQEHYTGSPGRSSQLRASSVDSWRENCHASPTRDSRKRASNADGHRFSHFAVVVEAPREDERSYRADQEGARRSGSRRVRSEHHPIASGSSSYRRSSEHRTESTRSCSRRPSMEHYAEDARSGSRRPTREHFGEDGRSGSRRPTREHFGEDGQSGSRRPTREHFGEDGRSGSRRPTREHFGEDGRSGSRRRPSMEHCAESPRSSSRRPPSRHDTDNQNYAGSSRDQRSHNPSRGNSGSPRSSPHHLGSNAGSPKSETSYSSRIASGALSILQSLVGGGQRSAEPQQQDNSYAERNSDLAYGSEDANSYGGSIHQEGDNYDGGSFYHDGRETASHHGNEYLNEEMVMQYDALFEAVAEGNAQLTRRILSAAKQIELDTVNSDDETCLMLASRLGHVEVMCLLIRRGAKLEFKPTLQSLTPLMLATKEGHLEIVEELLKRGAYVETTDERAHTPLFYACAHANDLMVGLLIKYGANINAVARVKDTQLVEEINTLGRPFHWPYGEEDCNWEATGEGKTPLHLTARFGHENIMTMLIQRGAYVDAPDNQGRTPIWWAAAKGHIACLRRLVRSYALVDTPDVEGNTPLMWAVRLSQHETAGCLLDFGANVNYHNPVTPQKAPLQWAIRYSDERMIHLLRAEGAVAHSPVYLFWARWRVFNFFGSATGSEGFWF